jgi:hypothetical protein
MTEGGRGKEELFKPIDGATGADEVTHVESYCVNCTKNVFYSKNKPTTNNYFNYHNS